MTSGTGLMAAGPLGLQEGPQRTALKNVTASSFVLGRVVQLDLALVDADTTNLKFGAAGSGYNHGILPQAGALGITSRMSIFAVVSKAAIPALDQGEVTYIGKVKALCLDSGAGNAWLRGEDGAVTAAGVLDFNIATLGRVCGRAEAALTSAVEVLADVFFNGFAPAIR